MVRELACIRFEVDLPAFPFLDQLEASGVRAHSDAHALHGDRDMLPRTLVVLLAQAFRRGGEVVCVPEKLEQGLPRPWISPRIVERGRCTAKFPATAKEGVEVPHVFLDVRPKFPLVRLRAVPQDVVKGVLVLGEPFIQRLESRHRSPQVRDGGVRKKACRYGRASNRATWGGDCTIPMRPKKALDAAGFIRRVASRRSKSASVSHSLYTMCVGPWTGAATYARRHP